MRDETFRLATGMNAGEDPRVLGTIGMDGVALAVWQREAAPGFRSWIDGLAPERLPAIRATVAAGMVGRAVLAACERAGTPDCAERTMLAEDAAMLAATFSRLTGAPFLNLRLDVVRGDSCRRWHVDRVPARLLCTYRGPGTEYGAADPDGTPRAIHRLETGAAAVFRGTLWPAAEFPGIVHRSPPIEGTSDVRLLLVLDPAEDGGAC